MKKTLRNPTMKPMFKLMHARWEQMRVLNKDDHKGFVATPLWPSVGVKPNTSKVGDLESFDTPECLEFDSKAQNTSHWSFGYL
jgi:hypothetical protein